MRRSNSTAARANSCDFTLDVARRNIQGSLELMEAARRLGVGRFVFISSCAVYGSILEDRPLDETHPLWPAVALRRPQGGRSRPSCTAMGRARPIRSAPAADGHLWHGQSADREEQMVRPGPRGRRGRRSPLPARAARRCTPPTSPARSRRCSLPGTSSARRTTATTAMSPSSRWPRWPRSCRAATPRIDGAATQPKNQIVTDKLRALGVEFGGEKLFEETIGVVAACRKNDDRAR